jgi:hypothetical protein
MSFKPNFAKTVEVSDVWLHNSSICIICFGVKSTSRGRLHTLLMNCEPLGVTAVKGKVGLQAFLDEHPNAENVITTPAALCLQRPSLEFQDRHCRKTQPYA